MTTEYLTNDTDLGVVANAIRAKTGKTDAIVYPDGFVTEIDSLVKKPNYRKWAGEITETIKGVSQYAELVTGDPDLAAHWQDDTLSVCVRFVPTVVEGYTMLLNRGYNVPTIEVDNTEIAVQYVERYGSDTQTLSANRYNLAVSNTENMSEYVGCVVVDSAGNLRCYSNSYNYAIRPGTWTVEIMW